jgi:hypothetical protein
MEPPGAGEAEELPTVQVVAVTALGTTTHTKGAQGTVKLDRVVGLLRGVAEALNMEIVEVLEAVVEALHLTVAGDTVAVDHTDQTVAGAQRAQLSAILAQRAQYYQVTQDKSVKGKIYYEFTNKKT